MVSLEGGGRALGVCGLLVESVIFRSIESVAIRIGMQS
jgi:hypothetical protein